MSLRHFAALFFGGRVEAAKKRVQKLGAAGWIKSRPRETFERAAYGLTARGVAEIGRLGEIPAFPGDRVVNVGRRLEVSSRTLRHELEVLDTVVALLEAARAAEPPQVATFSTWPAKHEFHVDGESVRPDAYLEFTEEMIPGTESANRHRFFLELDRSTESLGTLAIRANLYLAHLRSGGFAARHGGPGADPRAYPFRVLVVVKSEARRDHLAALLWQGDQPVLSLVWIATLADVLRDPLGAIWLRPVDHRSAASLRDATSHPRLCALYSPTLGQTPRDA